LHDADPTTLDRAKALLKDDESRAAVEKYLGRYAATAPEEVVAEAYTVLKHKDFDTLPSAAKDLVKHVLGLDAPR
jgi:hypothetical protein